MESICCKCGIQSPDIPTLIFKLCCCALNTNCLGFCFLKNDQRKKKENLKTKTTDNSRHKHLKGVLFVMYSAEGG